MSKIIINLKNNKHIAKFIIPIILLVIFLFIGYLTINYYNFKNLTEEESIVKKNESILIDFIESFIKYKNISNENNYIQYLKYPHTANFSDDYSILFLSNDNKVYRISIEGYVTAQTETGYLKEIPFNSEISFKLSNNKPSDLSVIELTFDGDNEIVKYDSIETDKNLQQQDEQKVDILSTPKFDEYLKAVETPNEGTNYDTVVYSLKAVQDLYSKGLVGTDDFLSFAKFISPNDIASVQEYEKAIGKITRYFTEDYTGITNFMKDLDANKLGEFNAQTGELSANIIDIEAAAKKMGMSTETFVMMFQKLNEYGYDTNIWEK